MRTPKILAWVAVWALLAGPVAAGSKKKASQSKTPVPATSPAPTAADQPSAPAGGDLGTNAPPAVREILEKVEKAQAAMKDVRMDLKMEVQDATSGQKQTVRGVVEMKLPDKVFTHYLKPTEQFLYINGPALQMYQPGQNTVYRQSTKKGQPTYLGVGKELKKYSETSRVSIVKDGSDQVVLLFIPDNGESQFKRMRVTIRKDHWWPEKVEIESLSMKTTAQFLKPVFDQGLPDSDFEFKAPEGATVVDGEIF